MSQASAKQAPEGRVTCICGSRIFRKNLVAHEKSIKHRKAIGKIDPKTDLLDKRGIKPVEALEKQYEEDSEEEDDPEFDALCQNMKELREDVWEVQDSLDRITEMICRLMEEDEEGDEVEELAEEDEEELTEEDDGKTETNTLQTVEESKSEEEEEDEALAEHEEEEEDEDEDEEEEKVEEVKHPPTPVDDVPEKQEEKVEEKVEEEKGFLEE